MSNNKCLGFIETFGLAACVAAADAAVKSANVRLLGYEYAKGGGMCTVKVEGNVGACRAAIAAGNYDIMAAVMIGGMVPPCAIALATLLFKDKFTKEERNPICGSRSDSCTSGMYLLALVVGTIVSAILLGVLKKKVA